MSVSAKIILVTSGVLALFFGGLFTYLNFEMRSYLSNEAVTSFEESLFAERKVLDATFTNISDTLNTLRDTPPIQGIIRAKKNNGIDIVDGSTLKQWKDRLSSIFVSEMNTTTLFLQLRYLDTEGQEMVRVNLVDGAAVRVDESDLQYKGDTSYVRISNDLAFNDIYVSRVELNREGADRNLSVPYTPVVRFVFPIFDEDTGERRGSLIGNVLFDELLKRTVLKTLSPTSVVVIDERGYYLLHQDAGKEWGAATDLDSQENIFTDIPALSEISNSTIQGSVQTDTDVFAYTKLFPNPAERNEYIVIIESVPKFVLFSSFKDTLTKLTVAAVVSFFILLLIVFFTVRRLLKPLGSLTKAAKEIGEGNFKKRISHTSTDELGLLGKTINTMSQNLEDQYGSLEKKVKQNTATLETKVSELESTKKALINVLDDVEEARRTAEVQEKKMTAILGSIGDGLVVLDEQGNITLINTAFERLLGWKKSEVLGKPFVDVVPLSLAGEVVPKKDRLITHSLKGEVFEKEGLSDLSYIRKDGSAFPVAISTAPVVVEGTVRGAVEVFRDITKEAEVDKAKTEFVSLASHQLRTPLTAIRWYVEMLLSEDAGALTPEQKEYVEEIASGNNRMIDLVNALLNVSRIELGTFAIEVKKVSLQDILSGLEKEFQPQVKEKNIALSIDTGKAPEVYLGDQKLLTIIFQNLLSNAIKYTPENGEVRCLVVEGAESLQIEVSDTGYGIPSEQQDRVFSKLFRADNVKKMDTTGTGLGLYIVKAIVEQSQGIVSFVSKEGEGTTFTVSLPKEGMVAKEGAKPLEA